MTYIKGTVKGIDGKTIRPIKNFTQAVDTVDNLIQAWKQARQNDDIPSHWDSNAPPCYGITKTISGCQLSSGSVLSMILPTLRNPAASLHGLFSMTSLFSLLKRKTWTQV